MNIAWNINDTLFADVELANKVNLPICSNDSNKQRWSAALLIMWRLQQWRRREQVLHWQRGKNLLVCKTRRPVFCLGCAKWTPDYKALNFFTVGQQSKTKMDGEQADLLLAQFVRSKRRRRYCACSATTKVWSLAGIYSATTQEKSRDCFVILPWRTNLAQQVARLLEQSEGKIFARSCRESEITARTNIGQNRGRLLLSTVPALGFSSLV